MGIITVIATHIVLVLWFFVDEYGKKFKKK
jgi:hypothetical protein